MHISENLEQVIGIRRIKAFAEKYGFTFEEEDEDHWPNVRFTHEDYGTCTLMSMGFSQPSVHYIRQEQNSTGMKLMSQGRGYFEDTLHPSLEELALYEIETGKEWVIDMRKITKYKPNKE